MTQQRKIRPSRAARARLKTRTPNLPQSYPIPDREVAPAPPREQAHGPAAGPVPFARVTPRQTPGVIQDYSYVRTDLVRIGTVSAVLLGLMLSLALVLR